MAQTWGSDRWARAGSRASSLVKLAQADANGVADSLDVIFDRLDITLRDLRMLVEIIWRLCEPEQQSINKADFSKRIHILPDFRREEWSLGIDFMRKCAVSAAQR